jgi:DNA-directed RNA polymerase subunit L|tara:strand:+ start:296 stop:571 length:276 start_codon:yes stop_codon:yes gene_type:complete
MEIKILEDKKNKLIFETTSMQQGILNALKKELYNDKHVKVATYTIKHPLIGKPKMVLETDGADPRDALVKAASRLKKVNDSFRKDFVKEVK